MDFSQKRPSAFLFRSCSRLCLSLLIRSFHLVCIDYRLTSHSDTLSWPYSCLQPPRHTLGPLWWGMSPFMAWTRLWKHVNNPQSVGATQRCCDRPTEQKMRPRVGLLRGEVTATVERQDSWMDWVINLIDAEQLHKGETTYTRKKARTKVWSSSSSSITISHGAGRWILRPQRRFYLKI